MFRLQTMGRVIGVSDDLAYCILYALGRHVAIGIPVNMFTGFEVVQGLRFYVDLEVPRGYSEWRHEDFDLADIKLVPSYY